jgi:RHS repeat-associated protein
MELVTPEDVISEYTLGETISGAISESGETDSYTFTGQVGQIIWFDSLLNASSANLFVYLNSPSGKLYNWTRNNWGQESLWLMRQYAGQQPANTRAKAIVLEEAGTYTIEMDGDGDTKGAYAFRFLDFADAPVVELDTDFGGTFGDSGLEAAAYRFTATAGQHLFFKRNIGEWNYGQNEVHLFDSFGNQVFYNDLFNAGQREITTLTRSGEYYLVFSGGNSANNSYNFRIVTPEVITTEYALGELISAEISEAGEQDWYTFEGTVGQRVFVDSLLTTNTGIIPTLYSPSGKTISWSQRFNQDARDLIVFEETGTYSLKVDIVGDGIGKYGFRILDIAEAEELTFNRPVTGGFGDSGFESRLYSFTGEQGDRIYFDGIGTENNGTYSLYQVNGELLFSSRDITYDEDFVLPATGDYLLAIAGKGGSSNTFTMEVVKPDLLKTSIPLGDTVSGEISVAGQRDTYVFDGRVGQQIFLDALGASSGLAMQLISPTGRIVSSNQSHQDWGPLTLTENGAYQLVLNGTYDWYVGIDRFDTGAYSFTLHDLSQVSELAINTPVSGSLVPGNSVALYQFTGARGTTLDFDLVASQWSGASWVLYDPGSQSVASSTWNNPDFKVALTTDGQYTLAIIGTSNSPVNYEFLIADTTIPAIENTGFNVVKSGAITSAGQVDRYSFDATAGTLAFFDSQDFSSAGGLRFRLINPDGSLAINNGDMRFDRVPNDFKLNQTGIYSLEVYGFSNTSTGTYRFQLLELSTELSSLNDSRSLNLGAVVTDSLEVSRAAVVYNFEGSLGEQIYLNGINTTRITARLIAPNGSEVFSLSNVWSSQDSGPHVLNQTGQYSLIIQGEHDSSVDYAFQLFSFNKADSLLFNLPNTGSLDSGLEQKIYQFNGQSGQTLFFDSQVNSNNEWKLYGPNGLLVRNNRLSNDFEAALTQDGLYTLLLGGSLGNQLDYRFRVFSYDEAEPFGAIIPGTGENSSSDGLSIGSFPIQISVEDGRGGSASQDYQIRLLPDLDNNAPVITSLPETSMGLNQGVYAYQIESFDLDNDRLVYRLVKSPSGSLINQVTGKVLWLPEGGLTVGDEYEFTVEVNDPRGGSAQQSFTVKIEDNDIRKGFGEIRGTIWDDVNSDRQRNVNEKGKAGIQVYLDLNANGRIDPGEPVNVTAIDNPFTPNVDETGQFKFIDLAPGTYIVRTVEPDGWVQTFPNEPLRVRDDGVLLASNLSLLQPDPNIAATFIGRAGISTDGFGSNENFNRGGVGLIQAEIPEGSTVEYAFLHVASRAFGDIFNPETAFRPGFVGFEGAQVPITWLDNVQDVAPRLNFETGRADVTSTVAAKVGNKGGIFNFEIDESIVPQTWNEQVEGISLTVIYSNPNLPEKTIVVLEGGLAGATPQTNVLLWQEPLDTSTQGFSSQLALGIQYGYQPNNSRGTQFSTIDINGERLTSSAGNSDDGIMLRNPLISVNGALITVGGVGDSLANPIDPYGDSYDDEFYTLVPFLLDGDTALRIDTANPSNDDSIFLAALTIPSVARLDSSGFLSINVSPEEIVDNVDFGISKTAAVIQNSAPTFISVPPALITIGSQLRYQAEATDNLPENDWVYYDLLVKPVGMVIDPNTGVVFWNPTSEQIGTVDVVIRAQDLYGGRDLQYFQLKVVPPNSAPSFTSSLSPTTPQVGKPFQYNAVAIDPDDDPITYSLANGAPTGMVVDAVTGMLTWTAATTQLGNHDVRLIASDDNGAETTQALNLTVIDAQPNTAPQITSQPRVTTRVNAPYLYQLTVQEPDGDPLTYTLVNAPEGMTLNERGLLAWQPKASQTGAHTITITVEDGQGGSDTQTYGLGVRNQVGNYAPEITSEPPYLTNIDRPYQYQAAAIDPDGDALFWELAAAPQGMVVDAQTGTVRWQPGITQVGEHIIMLQVTDALGSFAAQTFTLAVRGTNTPPQITSTPPTQIGIEQPYRYQIQAVDPEGDRIEFKLGRHPSGMTLDATTGDLLWIPQPGQIGLHDIELVAQDAQGGISRQTYTLLVTRDAVNQAPSITSSPGFWADVVTGYEYQVAASDPDGDSIAFSVLTGPTGMTIDPITGLLQWQPTAAQLGQQTVTVAAFDPLGLGGLQTYSLRVTEANQAPVIRSTPILTAAAETTYRYDLWASDPDGEPITLSLNRAPEGMVMDELGRITWATTKGDVGTYPIEIAVADSRGAVTLQTFDLAVQADTLAPRVSLAVSAVQVNLGETVTLKVSASDNVGVEFLTLTVNGEAIALDAQGLATTTRNNAGSFDVVATATDAAGNIGTATSTLFVLDPSDPDAPVVNLISLAGGAPFSTLITAPIGIIGTVTDDNLLFYTLAIAPMAGGVYTEIYRGTGAITNGILGNFDPSTLLNDTYRLRLEATDAGGNTAYDETLIDVTGELKLGNFQLSFTDLSVPVSGIPIQVTRTYDTLTANTRDDFGYGWRLEFRDTDLRTSLGPDLELQELGIASKGFSVGDRVYITLPGGKREGFTFRPTLHPINRFIPFAGNGSRLYRPAFEADPGVTTTLTVQRTDLIQLENGEFASLNGGRYNPANELYGFGGYYQLTTKEGIIYRIDAETGDLDTITDRNNNTLTFTDSSITSSTGQRVTFERDAQGRITAAIDPEGNRVTYQYDALGDLIAVTDREGHTTQFGYNGDRPHYLDEIIDPLGRTGIRSEYDENGRLKRLIDANGNPVELIYDPANDLQQVSDQLGHITTYEYDQRGNVLTEIDSLGGITRRTYDANNYMLTETDPLGNTTAFTYNATGDVLTETDALGNLTRYTYDANGNILTTTDPSGQTTTNTYDARGNLTQMAGQASGPLTFSYDAAGNLMTMQDGSGTTTFEYDAIGNITRQTDARGTFTTFAYDPKGNRTSETTTQTLADGTLRTLVTTMAYDKEGRVIRTIDAEGGVSETIYDAAGNRIETIDALGRSTKYIYDERGQLIATLYPDATPDDDSDNPRTRTEYDAKGQVIAQIDELGRRTVMVYDALGRQIATLYPDATPGDNNDNPRTQTIYDAAGRVETQIDQRGNRTELRYDAAGRVIETILPDETPDDLGNNPRFTTAYDAAGRQLTQTDSLGQVTQFLYDALGRPVGQRYADGTSTAVSYDAAGRVAARTDQAGVTTRFKYNALGRLTAVVDARNQRTTYTYDEQGNLLTQTDANGNATRYEYDRLGRRVATDLPLGERSTSTYNAVGNLVSITDFNGDSKTYAYDERNRLIAKDLPGTEFDEAHTYLANGLRDTVTNGRGTTTYRYDERNRLTGRIDPDGTTIAYSYDAAGNRTSVQIPSGTTAYGFDAQNRLKTVTDPEGGITTYTYNPVGNLARTEFPNGTVEIREYDDLNRLLYIETSGPAGIIASFRYTLDATGNRTEVVEHDGRRVAYEYDRLYRLTAEIIYDPGATGPSRIIDYVYDDVGNRLSRTDTGEGTSLYTYDDNDQLLTATTDGVATTYTYDNNGNTTSKTTDGTAITYAWNADNRLIGADTNGDGVIDVRNRYNENGIRVSQTVNGEETRFLIDANRPYAQVLEEYTPGGIIKVSYMHGNDLISQNRGGEKSFYHVDGLGSTRILTTLDGRVLNEISYDAYGQTWEIPSIFNTQHLFAGEYRDLGLDLDYLRARYLDVSTGRFLSRDPFEGIQREPITLTKYIYGNNNPLLFIDPTGEFSISETKIVQNLQSTLAKINLTFKVARQIKIWDVNGAVGKSGDGAYSIPHAFIWASRGNNPLVARFDISFDKTIDVDDVIRSPFTIFPTGFGLRQDFVNKSEIRALSQRVARLSMPGFLAWRTTVLRLPVLCDYNPTPYRLLPGPNCFTWTFYGLAMAKAYEKLF